MKIAIVYSAIIDRDGSRLTVGGLQNYLLSLAEVCMEHGWETAIIQLGNRDFEWRENKVHIYGHRAAITVDDFVAEGRFLTGKAIEWFGGSDGLIIYGTDLIVTGTGRIPSIAIQHGVTNDAFPPADNGAGFSGIRVVVKKALENTGLGQLYRTYRRNAGLDVLYRGVESADTTVCVDYNFLNTYKILGRNKLNGTLVTIPNFARLATPDELSTRTGDREVVKVLFARRFEWYRGTRLIAPVVKRLIEAHEHMRFTFAGEGPDEAWLREYFADTPRVDFIRYGHDDALATFLRYQVAVVPSLGSEGTSLSALEAMSAGCAVVATCVGGLTNVILDDFNGKLVMPDEQELYEAISYLVHNPDQMQRIADNAYETVRQAFSKDIWRAKWIKLLTDLETTHYDRVHGQ